MSVAILITDANQPAQLLPWAARFSRAKKTDLLVIIPRRGKGDPKWKTLDLASDESAIVEAIRPIVAELSSSGTDAVERNSVELPQLQVRELSATDPGWALVEEIDELPISLLVIPAPVDNSSSDEHDWHRSLFADAPCQTMYLRDDAHQSFDQPRVLVAVTGQDDDTTAIKCASEFVRAQDGVLTAIYVGRAVDEVSYAVGQRILRRTLGRALGAQHVAEVKQDIVLADNLAEGIRLFGAEEFQLVLCGRRGQRDTRRLLECNFFINEVPENLPAIGIIRREVPLTSRMVRWLESRAERVIPQLEREQRISLVERIQSSSDWDVDFVALICLATLIAGLGLIDDSIAVIVGGMLVAPLMTPIVATGLALAQGNAKLIRGALRTVIFAFALCFSIGFLALGPYSAATDDPPQLTPQMTERGNVKQLHLFVGLFSGMAAAYATGRPNLLSALPGVAIAAALVPPLATSGIATWHLTKGTKLAHETAVGALALFGANMLAIIVGTALTFWLVGIRPTKKEKKSQAWPVWLFMVLIGITIMLALMMK